MRIIDKENKKTLASVLLMLTPSEVSELISKLKTLDPAKGDHLHVDDLDYQREITIAIYTDQNLHFFTEEIARIIREN
jgi:hypothetical protein